MRKEPLRILGINPGTKYLGLAVFQNRSLFDWRVKRLDGKWSKDKIDKAIGVISDHVDLYDLNTVALKELHPARSSKNLRLLVSRINVLARQKKLRISQFSIKELEKFLLEEVKYNKKNLAEKMAVDYPCLIHELEKENTNKNSYNQRTFEAVALGAACFQKSLEAKRV